jgi:hypothetical protein
LLLLGAYLGWLGLGSRPAKVQVDTVSAPGDGKEARLGRSDGTTTRREEVAMGSEPNAEPAPPAPAAPPGLPDFPKQQPDAKPHEPRPVFTGNVGGMLQSLDEARERAGKQSGNVGSPKGTKEGTGRNGSGTSGALATDPVPRGQRWDLHFNTLDARDYLRQLQGLGAVLAIPTGPDGSGYKVLRELSRRPVRLLDEDVTQIPGILWKDYEPRAVEGLVRELGLTSHPDHFGAFLPVELEEKLARLEREYAGRTPGQIARTYFRVELARGRYDVRVVNQDPLR